jgi:hypothetical protein
MKGSLQPTNILYASDAGWVVGPLGETAPDTSKTRMWDCVSWVSKVTYLLYHRITPDDVERILAAYGIDKTSPHFDLAASCLSGHQTRYQREVLTDYVYLVVGIIIATWTELEENRNRELHRLATAERESVWRRHFDADPERVVTDMWGTVAEVLSLVTIYDDTTDYAEDDKAKLAAVRKMLRSKFVFACEETYKHRYLPDPTTPLRKSEAQCFSNLSGYSDMPEPRQTIVPYEHLPGTSVIPGSKRELRSDADIDVSDYLDVIKEAPSLVPEGANKQVPAGTSIRVDKYANGLPPAPALQRDQ